MVRSIWNVDKRNKLKKTLKSLPDANATGRLFLLDIFFTLSKEPKKLLMLN